MCIRDRAQEEVRQDIEDLIRGDAAADLQSQAFSREFIRDCEPLQRLAIHRAIVDEIPGPDMVLVFRSVADATVAMVPNSTLFADFLGHSEALTLPMVIDPFEIHLPALLTKFRRNEAIAITRKFAYELMNA